MRLLFSTLLCLSFPCLSLAQEINLEESDLIVQTAEDILSKISDDDGAAVVQSPPPLKAQVPPPKKQLPLPSSSLLQGESHVMQLSFAPSQTVLSPEHESILLEKVLVRLLEYRDARVEIIAYASGFDVQESVVRRLSFHRGQAIREFLLSKGVDERQMYLRPLGRAPQGEQEYVELSIYRL